MPLADKIVVVVFDGLRPDMVAGRMPVLEAFLRDNLWFRNARSVFPSVTRVCTTSFATGAWPGAHGIVNNQFHLAGHLEEGLVDTGAFAHLARLKARAGALVTTDSLGQRLAAAGRRMLAVHCGSAGSGLLVNHAVRDNGHRTFSVHGSDATLTPDVTAEVLALCGTPPADVAPKIDTVAYAGHVARRVGLAEDQADVTLVWLPEPDTAFHFCGIHSDGAAQAMAAADAAFAEILDAVTAGPHAGRTAVVAMSDHGQIATRAKVDLAAMLRSDGFAVGAEPGAGTDILMTGGNMGELRPLAPSRALLRDLGQWLIERNEIGMVFADPEVVDGALSPALVHQTHLRSAELIYVMRSDTGAGPGGLPGTTLYTGGVPVGGGMHGGLNPYEMNTVLGFSLPDGRRADDDTPAALIDIAPTLLSLLGIEDVRTGRVLPLFEPEGDPVYVEVARAETGAFRQELRRATVAGRSYLIDGGRAGTSRTERTTTEGTQSAATAPQ
ncbi:MAG: alkaline phosphatase family protein [Pseudomonadota bacterium]